MKIATIRAKKGLTQEQLASACATTQQQIAKIEKGLVDPRLSTLRRIADALDCELRDLFLTRQEFLKLVQETAREQKLTLAKVGILGLNHACARVHKLNTFHPFWEQVEIKENQIRLKEI